MKKYGFTIVELLAVITILGLLAAIIYPVVNTSIRKSEKQLYDVQIENIEAGARSWGASNISKLPMNNGESINITLGELQDAGYIEKDLINPKTDKPFPRYIVITIKMNDNSLEYNVGV